MELFLQLGKNNMKENSGGVERNGGGRRNPLAQVKQTKDLAFLIFHNINSQVRKTKIVH